MRKILHSEDCLKTNIAKAEEAEYSTSSSDATEKKGPGERLVKLAVLLGTSILLYLIFNRLVFFNSYVPTDSMMPGINPGDRLLGNRLIYLFEEPQRGDVVIARHSCDENGEKEFLIKRIIGLPGDKVEIKEGKLFINDEELSENYIFEEMNGTFGPYFVPEDGYFLLGDNRNISMDARFWQNTFVEKKEIAAKAWLKYYPKICKIK